jgi:hypothetical protein
VAVLEKKAEKTRKKQKHFCVPWVISGRFFSKPRKVLQTFLGVLEGKSLLSSTLAEAKFKNQSKNPSAKKCHKNVFNKITVKSVEKDQKKHRFKCPQLF